MDYRLQNGRSRDCGGLATCKLATASLVDPAGESGRPGRVTSKFVLFLHLLHFASQKALQYSACFCAHHKMWWVKTVNFTASYTNCFSDMDADDALANLGITIIFLGLIVEALDGLTGWCILSYLTAVYGPVQGFVLWYAPLWIGAIIKALADTEEVLEPVSPVLSRTEDVLGRLQDGENPLERDQDDNSLG